jgi:hypothetical protein
MSVSLTGTGSDRYGLKYRARQVCGGCRKTGVRCKIERGGQTSLSYIAKLSATGFFILIVSTSDCYPHCLESISQKMMAVASGGYKDAPGGYNKKNRLRVHAS